jgi:type VI protein secretion system component Hcp
MTAKMFAAKRSSWLLGAAVIAGAFATFGMTDVAHAQRERGDLGYVGNSYLQIPGVDGGWRGANYRDSIRVDAHYWRRPVPSEPGAEIGEITAARNTMTGARRGGPGGGQGGQQGQGGAQAQGQGQQGQQAQAPRLRTRIGDAGLFTSVPPAPVSGGGQVVIALNKDSPDLPALMERCRTGAAMPEVTYSVETFRYRRTPERGPMPADMPRYFDYRLHNAQIVDCPVLEGATQQALVVSFDNIDWLNWTMQAVSNTDQYGRFNSRQNLPASFTPAELPPLPRRLSGETRAWVVTWFGWAHGGAEQCPVMDEKPSVESFYTLVSDEQEARERAVLADQGGGPDAYAGQGALRGPHRLDVTQLPGIIPDPGLPEPQTEVAEGVNLDGSNGGGHVNFRSEDGAITGIDNQLYRTMGCVPGYMDNGLITQYGNNQMRDGEFSMLVEVAGIDNMQNDREVYVTFLYSRDAMAKNASGSDILPDYTFHVTDEQQYTHYFSRVRARIVDGALTVGPLDHFRLNLGFYGQPNDLDLIDSRMRLELREDGTMAGVIGGYRDWRHIVSYYGSGMGEFVTNYEVPGFYQAMRRNADGLRNPVTGEYDGISTAYHVDAVPAFIVRQPSNVASVGQSAGGR